jgi:hypothetical protein
MTRTEYVPQPHWTARQWASIERSAAQARTFRAYAAAGKKFHNPRQHYAMAESAHHYEREIRRFAVGVLAVSCGRGA